MKNATLKTYTVDLEDSWSYRTGFVVTLIIEGEEFLVMECTDGGEPEDNTFGRDWGFVLGMPSMFFNLFATCKVTKFEKEDGLKGWEEYERLCALPKMDC